MADLTTAWKTPRELAECRVAAMLGGFTPETDQAVDQVRAAAIVDAIFSVLAEADRDMLEAGARELELALPPDMRQRARVRQLVAATWRSMFAECR